MSDCLYQYIILRLSNLSSSLYYGRSHKHTINEHNGNAHPDQDHTYPNRTSSHIYHHSVGSFTAQVPPAAEMLLANALYFKAPWKNAFDAESTHSDCFYYNGVCRNVAMMDIQSCLNYAYVDQLRAHAFELPYEVFLSNLCYKIYRGYVFWPSFQS